ncbi:hypothetical protein MMC06_000788 [Schaereria dolodes]|nr:hypothetical protein [Schaereria dolodes]
MPDDPKRLLINPVLKDEVYFLKYSSETNGQCTRLRIKLDPSGGPPLHYHNTYTETFSPSPAPASSLPNSNDLGVELDSKLIRITQGESVTVPMGTVHRFYSPYDDHSISFECELRPGNEGFEKSLSILYGLARDGLCNGDGIPKSPVHLSLVGRLGDFNSAGWGPWLMTPLIWGFVKYGKWSGEEERLVRKYWQGS